jgi:hypothetical protein
MLHTVRTGRGIDVHPAHGILDERRHLLRVVLRVTVLGVEGTPLGYPPSIRSFVAGSWDAALCDFTTRAPGHIPATT